MNAQIPVIYRALAERQEAVDLIEAGMVLVQKSEQYPRILSDTDAAVVSELRARLNAHINRVDEERLSMTAEARKAQKTVNDEFGAQLKPMRTALERIDSAIKAHVDRKRAEEDRLRRERDAELQRAKDAEAARVRLAEEAERTRKAAEEAAARASERGSGRSLTEAARAQRVAEEAAMAAAAATTAAVEAGQRAAEVAALPAVPTTRAIAGTYGSKTTMRDNWKYKVVDVSQVPEHLLVPPEERVQKAALNAMARAQKDKAKVPGIEFYNDPTPMSREGA